MERFKEFVACYLDAWRKFVDFGGRATRKDYWGFILINMLVTFVVGFVEAILGMDEGFVSSLYTLAVICPNISLCARRLHDVNKSGWWQMTIIIPVLNFYYVYLLWIKPGTEGINKFGAPAASAAKPVYGAYSVPVENEFSGYEMCPAPKPAQAEAEPVIVEPELPQLRKKCISCGAEIKVSAKFCSECGAQQ